MFLSSPPPQSPQPSPVEISPKVFLCSVIPTAVPQFKQSADGLSPCKLCFSPNEVRVDFVVNKVLLVELLLSFPISVSPLVFISHSFAYHRLCTP